MSNLIIQSKIDSSNIIRQKSIRASKDRALGRIAVPLENLPPLKKTINRSKSVIVKKTYEQINELETQLSSIISLCSSDDDEEDNYIESTSETSESSEDLIDSSDEEVLKSSKPLKIVRQKTFAGSRQSTCIKTIEHKKMNPTSFADEIPCRDKEFDQIYLSISTLICNNDGGCIFVVGVPGTGKTATVSAVIDCLEASDSDIPDFRRVSINGMHVTEVREVYSVIYKELTNKKISKARAISCLEKELLKKSKTKKSTVILIDEIDQLHTKKEDVLYKIFGWAQRRESRLIIIAIANTMDLPERLTQNKVTSRSGVTRYIFQPYNHEQLLTILKVKLNQKGFKENIDLKALELAAKKVAAASGDVRRILEIFRRILELRKEGKIIDLHLVDFILKEMFSQPKIAALRNNCSFYEKLFLKSIVATFKSSGLEETKLRDVFRHLFDQCKLESVKVPNTSEIFSILVSLGSYKLILFDSLTSDIDLTLRLNCSQENINFALSNK